VYAGKIAYMYKGTVPANTSITLTVGTKGIANNAFQDCSNLISVTIPASVTSIGEYSFVWCIDLISVTFTSGSDITNSNFGNSAFPEGINGLGGNTLRTAYNTGKAGTYTRAINGDIWTKQ